MGDAAIETRKWTRVEYDRLAEAEILGSADRIELLGGAHDRQGAAGQSSRLPESAWYSAPSSLRSDPAGMCESRRRWRSTTSPSPSPTSRSSPAIRETIGTLILGGPRSIVEVALSRLSFDREHKGSLYARAGIADYWIVNLPDRRVEVYRDPVPDAGAVFGWRYGRTIALRPDERVAPLAAPTAAISVADLLP